MITPSDILTVGDALHSNSQAAGISAVVSETFRRAAVGRWYYSAFHKAQDVATSHVLPQPQGNVIGSHNILFNRLIGCTSVHAPHTHRDIVQAGYIARGILQDGRVHADYKLNIAFEEDKAQLIRQKIAQFHQLLNK